MEANMRDIRADLRERLRNIEEDSELLKAKLKNLDERRAKILALFEDEEQRWSNLEPSLFDASRRDDKESVSLSDIILTALSHGRAWSTDEFKKVAIVNHWPVDRNAPGRSLNMALVGLQRRGQVEKLETGEWRLVKNDASPEQTGEAP
jgi:hypothetical protein